MPTERKAIVVEVVPGDHEGESDLVLAVYGLSPDAAIAILTHLLAELGLKRSKARYN
jgi:hypothetical protein